MKKILLLLTAVMVVMFYGCDSATTPVDAKCAKGKYNVETGISLVDNETVCKIVDNGGGGEVIPPESGGDNGSGEVTPPEGGGDNGSGEVTPPEDRPIDAELIKPLSDKSVYYARNNLSADEQKIFDAMLVAAFNYDDNATVKGAYPAYISLKDLGVKVENTKAGENYLNKIAKWLYYSDTRLYFLNGFVTRQETTFVENGKTYYDKIFLPVSAGVPRNYKKRVLEGQLRSIKIETDKILAKVTSDMTELVKVKVIHDEFLRHISYGQVQGDPKNIFGAFVLQKVICDGYAQGLLHLLHMAGIQGVLIFGNNPADVFHAWLKVKVDGNWYNIDPTENDGLGAESPYVAYRTFLVSDHTFSVRGYKPGERYAGELDFAKLSLPVANSDHPLTGLNIDRNHNGYLPGDK